MANPEHVALMLQGAKAIAEWRQKHPKERLDLSGASLGGAYLSGAKLASADLSEANLSEADLSGADLLGADLPRGNLFGANLTGAELWAANLFGANLSGTNLYRADLFAAILTEANLNGANLSWATLSLTNLSGANLSQAELGFTSLGNLDLSGVRGLSDVRHSAPSTVGVDTLVASYRGAGNRLTPELRTFFLGAGVPPKLLDTLPTIVGEAQYYSCFISYGEPDLEFAKKLKGGLEARGLSCWLYDTDKTVGKPTWGEIEQKLDEYERMVVVCSIKALIRDGFKKEVDKQIDKNPDKLIPVSLDDDWKQDGFKAEWAGRDLKKWLMDRNWADFSGWDSEPSRYDKALEELLKGLKLEKPAD